MKKKNKVEDYLLKQSEILNLQFKEIRESTSDRDVKGGKNEKTLLKFIEKNYRATTIKSSCEIIDSKGNYSDEIDIVICNEYQPFAYHPLIAEGVDACIQVKGTITSQEIDKIIKNSKKIKQLKREFHETDKYVISNFMDYEALVLKIPYIVFAFDSQLSFETLTRRMNEKQEAKGEDWNSYPDAIFVLNKGVLINTRMNFNHPFQPKDKKTHGYIGFLSEKKTLLELIRFLHTSISKHSKLYHPLNYYFNETEVLKTYARWLTNEEVESILENINEDE